MKKVLLFILLALPASCWAQKYYVPLSEDRIEQPLIDRLLETKHQIVFKEDSADYIIRSMITYQALSSAKGYIVITDKSGQIVAKSKEYGSLGSSWNTSPGSAVIKKIANKNLLKIISSL
ncbi:hypothetical protein [Chitinophaga japonensis]|uniref:Uncharacterized protein n=1 Tax=Chitinophaga japonensis TaxID=104662 RepID=A0A562SYF8_CHIJA|nr:hypothetical protein [Chitinophaga japonensis]TWI86342.1 hypothetical protein LX66_3596 [Chitinophaga japonensis]